MKNQYSIEEILNAVYELNNLKKKKEEDIALKISKQKNNKLIPDHTIRLIEEAEKSKND